MVVAVNNRKRNPKRVAPLTTVATLSKAIRRSHVALQLLLVGIITSTVGVPIWLYFQIQEEKHKVFFRSFPSNKNGVVTNGVIQDSLPSIQNRSNRNEMLQNEPVINLSRLRDAAERAEKEILQFFHGEARALRDGVSNLGCCSSSSEKRIAYPNLSQRIANRLQECHHLNQSKSADAAACKLRIIFVGSGQMSGRDNFRNQTFPIVAEKRLQKMLHLNDGDENNATSFLQLELFNHAMDNDLGREGPQTCHMCIGNLVGFDREVDVVVWGFDDSMKKGRSAQFEAFVRWVSQARPALIIVNRDGPQGIGPHGMSRRGEQHVVVDISPGHTAIVYKDNNHTIQQRQEAYQNSTQWKQRWQNRHNKFWPKLFDHYSDLMDFAMIDPLGAIWHLDHLLEFSNMAFDNGKALPFIDCGYPGHPPPCNEVPQFIQNHLANRNLTVENIPNDTDGVLCGGPWGCRHSWYGGPRSHELRGELNALPIVHAMAEAAEKMATTVVTKGLNTSAVSALLQSTGGKNQNERLPVPEFCNPKFCSRIPLCITSYEPNLGLKLSLQMMTNQEDKKRNVQKSNTKKRHEARQGVVHFANNPAFQLKDIEKRFGPLGYSDRKFAYRLAIGPDDAASMMVSIPNTMEKDLLIVCEPPGFADEFPKRRIVPAWDTISLERLSKVDGAEQNKFVQLKQAPPKLADAAEVGHFCRAVVVDSNSHQDPNIILRISTNATAPAFVMISHVIAL